MYNRGHFSFTKVREEIKHGVSLRWLNYDWTFDIWIIKTMVLAHVIVVLLLSISIYHYRQKLISRRRGVRSLLLPSFEVVQASASFGLRASGAEDH